MNNLIYAIIKIGKDGSVKVYNHVNDSWHEPKGKTLDLTTDHLYTDENKARIKTKQLAKLYAGDVVNLVTAKGEI